MQYSSFDEGGAVVVAYVPNGDALASVMEFYYKVHWSCRVSSRVLSHLQCSSVHSANISALYYHQHGALMLQQKRFTI